MEPAQLAQISWAQFLELVRIDDPWKRAFYETELLRDRWSKRQLQRQIGSLLYERTGLSADKAAVVGRARSQEPRETITELLRDPYILEPADEEQAVRKRAAASRQNERAEAERRERARVEGEWRALDQRREEERQARMRDPRYQAKLREAELKEKYGLNEYVDPADYPKLMGLVRQLDRGNRIGPDEFAWLSTHGWSKYDCYLTPEMESRYHEIEARFLVDEFKRTGDPWQAVNASSHFRKCGQPGEADTVLGRIDVSRIRDVKLRSAFCTTHGGVKRDLGSLDAAFELGTKAHALTPRDFRPCTLLGAVSYERGDCEQGRAWYVKAVERGFDEGAMDGELRSIFWGLDARRQAEMRAHLLGMDPVRYKWAASTVRPAGRRDQMRGIESVR